MLKKNTVLRRFWSRKIGFLTRPKNSRFLLQFIASSFGEAKRILKNSKLPVIILKSKFLNDMKIEIRNSKYFQKKVFGYFQF